MKSSGIFQLHRPARAAFRTASFCILGATLLRMASGPTPASAAASAGGELVATHTLSPGDSLRVRFSKPPTQSGMCLALEFDARLDFKTFAGSSLALAISINGTPRVRIVFSTIPLVFARPTGAVTWRRGPRRFSVRSIQFAIGPGETKYWVSTRTIGFAHQRLLRPLQRCDRHFGNISAARGRTGGW